MTRNLKPHPILLLLFEIIHSRIKHINTFANGIRLLISLARKIFRVIEIQIKNHILFN